MIHKTQKFNMKSERRAYREISVTCLTASCSFKDNG